MCSSSNKFRQTKRILNLNYPNVVESVIERVQDNFKCTRERIMTTNVLVCRTEHAQTLLHKTVYKILYGFCTDLDTIQFSGWLWMIQPANYEIMN